jgi:hypothetical protein
VRVTRVISDVLIGGDVGVPGARRARIFRITAAISRRLSNYIPQAKRLAPPFVERRMEEAILK